MDAQTTEHADVVVVGAGPTGLLLAGDLVEAGVRVVLLERRAGESNLARAFAVHARTMEQLQIRGVADELAATGTTIGKLVLYGRAAIDLSRLPSRYPSLLITPQSRTEEVLTRRLHRLGGSIVDGSEVTGVAQDANGVEVRVRTVDGAERSLPGVLRGRGGRRPQRRAHRAGPALPRTFRGALADVGRRPPDRPARGRPGGQRRRRRVRLRRAVRGRLVPRLRLEPPPPGGRHRSGRAVRGPRGDPTRAGHRLRDARPALPVAVPQRRAAGPELPGRARLPGRRRGALPLPGRRAGHEHRHPGRGQPRLEAGGRGDRLGRRRRCWTPTTPSGTRWAGRCCAAAGCSSGWP